MEKIGRAFKRLVCKLLNIPLQKTSTSNLPKFDMKHLNRAIACKNYYDLIRDYKGCIVEAGVGQGRGLAIWTALTLHEGKNRKLWAFDSYEGFPSLAEEDQASDEFLKGLTEYKQFNIPYVRATLHEFGISHVDIDRTISMVKGFIPKSCEMFNGGEIALLYLDLDIYEGYRDAIAFFYDKVTPGGIIVFDEYLKPLDSHKWPGASKAINEFLNSKGLHQSIRICDLTGNRYLIKS